MFCFWLLVIIVTGNTKFAVGEELDLPTDQEFTIPKVLDRLADRNEPWVVSPNESRITSISFAASSPTTAGCSFRCNEQSPWRWPSN